MQRKEEGGGRENKAAAERRAGWVVGWRMEGGWWMVCERRKGVTKLGGTTKADETQRRRQGRVSVWFRVAMGGGGKREQRREGERARGAGQWGGARGQRASQSQKQPHASGPAPASARVLRSNGTTAEPPRRIQVSRTQGRDGREVGVTSDGAALRCWTPALSADTPRHLAARAASRMPAVHSPPPRVSPNAFLSARRIR